MHLVDALVLLADEGRRSHTIGSGELATSFDPEISEWENPLNFGHPLPNT